MSAVGRKERVNENAIPLSREKKRTRLDEIGYLVEKALIDRTDAVIKTSIQAIKYSTLPFAETKQNLVPLKKGGLINEEKFWKILFRNALQNRDQDAFIECTFYLESFDFYLDKVDKGNVSEEEFGMFLDSIYSIDPENFQVDLLSPSKIYDELKSHCNVKPSVLLKIMVQEKLIKIK